MFHQRAGRIEQFDHFHEKSSYFSLIGRLLGTIKPLPKTICISHQRAGCLEQLDHYQEIFVFFTNRQVA
jgi:hypothetical protein